MAPGACKRRDAGDRAIGDRRAGVALRADAQADQGRLVLRERARELADVGGRDSAHGRVPLDGLVREPLDQLVVAERVGTAPLLVGEARVEQRPHDAERERGIRARERSQVRVGDARRAAAEGIDDDEPRSAPARFEDQAPQVRSRRERVPAPRDDRARVHPLLGIDLGRGAVGRHRARHAGARADGAHERRAADRVEQAIGHHVALHETLRAEIAVRHDRAPPCRAIASCSPRAATSSASSQVAAAESPSPLAPARTSGCRSRSVGVHALEVVGDLAAQEAGGDRVVGVALDARRAARGVDLDEQRAGVGAIVRAGPADDSGGGAHGDFDPTREAAISRRNLPLSAPNPIAVGCYGRKRGALTDSLTAHRRRVPGVRVFVAAAIAAAVVAAAVPALRSSSALGATAACTPGAAWPGTNASLAQQVVALVNQHRASLGLGGADSRRHALGLGRLEGQPHGATTATSTTTTRLRPSRATRSRACSNCGYAAGGALGENIAFGQTSPTDVMTAWIDSPGHRANIENPSFRSIGVGAAADGGRHGSTGCRISPGAAVGDRRRRAPPSPAAPPARRLLRPPAPPPPPAGAAARVA